MQTNFKNLIKTARSASRDILRAEKVSALLGYIQNQEARLTQRSEDRKTLEEKAEKTLATATKVLARSEYTLRVAQDTSNPDLEDIDKDTVKARETFETFKKNNKASITATLKEHDEYTVEVKKEVDEKVAEYNGKIEAWNNGESKVSGDRMKSMALEMIKDRVGQSFVQGQYDDAVAEVEAPAEENTADEVSS